jgi:hypothetical protein
MIKSRLVFDHFHSYFLAGVFPNASNHLPEGALAKDILHYISAYHHPLECMQESHSDFIMSLNTSRRSIASLLRSEIVGRLHAGLKAPQT